MSCFTKLSSIEFSESEINETVERKGLLSIEVELSLRCNFRCPYCYVPDKKALENEMSLEEIKDVIDQAAELGAKKIVLLGGEPMLYPYLFEVIEYIRSLELEIEMFTNGFGITSGVAEQLMEYKVNVVLKMNTFDAQLQDKLAGHKGAYTVIHDAFKNLRAAGYPSRNPFMAVSTIICKDNIAELPKLWKWLRDQNIQPYFEMITPQGDATENKWLEPEVKDVEQLFDQLQQIDKDEYEIEWDAQPPLVGNKCLRHKFSCLIGSQGDVLPCVGVPLSVGNIRERSLHDILDDSVIINNLRKHKSHIKGPCGTCEKAEHCYGCRGAAYNLTGDYLASDPLCWKNTDKQDEIIRLPMSIDSLVPHERPMQIVDTLISVGERKAKASVAIEENNLFVDANNILDPAALPEMVAQSIAAMNGFLNMAKENGASEGFLLGIKSFNVCREVKVGELLTIEVFKAAKLGDFGIIEGKIFSADHLVAEGEIKVWHK